MVSQGISAAEWESFVVLRKIIVLKLTEDQKGEEVQEIHGAGSKWCGGKGMGTHRGIKTARG